ncbi:MAG: DHH family phosphoesterase [Candidatus Bathyarchaeota archaeon]|nr:DHH family phosphoesterase [Candidatus Bathyarchaeota archaeon]MDH5494248.1 DHH family phosphoesterase [Candidatus Bathyarchaeota archaeon]
MAIEENAKKAFTSDASKAAKLISKCAEEGGFIHVISHLDADGLAAAGVIGKALWRLGANFRVRIQQWVDEKIVADITSDKPTLTLLTDLGSGYLNVLSKHLSNNQIVVLDHHQPIGDVTSNILQVNPHLHGIDGSKDISGAGVAYFAAKALDDANKDLAGIAVVGALGDLQDKYEQRALGGLNETVVADAVAVDCLKVEKDLMFFGRETRPIHKALAYTTSPFLPDISGEEDKSLAFLVSLGIKPKHGDKWRALRDLSEEQKRQLCSALSDHLISKGYPSDVLNLVGSVYTLVHEEPWTPLRDAREFSVLLNGTGRMEKAGLGVAICMGDRGSALEQAEIVLREYRRTITKYLSWLMEEPDRIDELESIYVVRGEGFINEKVIGTLSSILSTSLPKLEKPIIAYAVADEEVVKVSARTLDMLTSRGLDLGEIMRVAAEKFEGKGGGHDIAAGAQVPIKDVDAFVKLVDELVKKRMEQIEAGS